MEAQWTEQQKSKHEGELDNAQTGQRQLQREVQRKETDPKRRELAEQESASQVPQRAAMGGPTLLICPPSLNGLWTHRWFG